jgi:WD40 repeat protein
VYVWDLETENIVNKIHHEGEEIANFSVSTDGAFLATYTSNNLLRLLDINDNYRQIAVSKLPHYFPIDMAFSPNGKYLALGCVNSHVKIVSVPGLK